MPLHSKIFLHRSPILVSALVSAADIGNKVDMVLSDLEPKMFEDDGGRTVDLESVVRGPPVDEPPPLAILLLTKWGHQKAVQPLSNHKGLSLLAATSRCRTWHHSSIWAKLWKRWVSTSWNGWPRTSLGGPILILCWVFNPWRG